MPSDNLEINEAIAAQFAQLVLDCIEREYPNSNLYWADSDEDIKPPRQLTPAFYGCLDWHWEQRDFVRSGKKSAMPAAGVAIAKTYICV